MSRLSRFGLLANLSHSCCLARGEEFLQHQHGRAEINLMRRDPLLFALILLTIAFVLIAGVIGLTR